MAVNLVAVIRQGSEAGLSVAAQVQSRPTYAIDAGSPLHLGEDGALATTTVGAFLQAAEEQSAAPR